MALVFNVDQISPYTNSIKKGILANGINQSLNGIHSTLNGILKKGKKAFMKDP
jgi:hypothetical protein